MTHRHQLVPAYVGQCCIDPACHKRFATITIPVDPCYLTVKHKGHVYNKTEIDGRPRFCFRLPDPFDHDRTAVRS